MEDILEREKQVRCHHCGKVIKKVDAILWNGMRYVDWIPPFEFYCENCIKKLTSNWDMNGLKILKKQ